VLLGLLRFHRWKQDLPLSGTLLITLLLLAGASIPHNPIYALVRRIPYVLSRYGFRYFWPLSFAFAALGGQGAELLIPPRREGLWRHLAPALLIILLGIDLWPLSQFYQTTESYLPTEAIALHRHLGRIPGQERYWVPFLLKRPGRHYADTSYGVRYNRRASINDDEYHTPTAPYRATLFFRQALRGQLESPQGLSASAQAILDLSNVRYLLLPLQPQAYQEVAENLLARPNWQLIEKTASTALLENLSVRPFIHAYHAGLSCRVLSDESLLSLLPQALARGYALVEQPSQQDTLLFKSERLHPPDALPSLPPLAPAKVQFVMARPKANEIRVRFQAEEPFIMLVSESWYPHWHIYLNGKERPLLRVNGNFIGAYIPAHQGEILLHYRQPWYFWAALCLSAASLLGTIIYLAWPQPVRLRPDAG
ncbi:MAG: hypothetical protein J7M05_01495, partial [Anaerolineae bacterium]|nr:hypothetical protein [Anaerolineae bacterium]